MSSLIHTFSGTVEGPAGRKFNVGVHGHERRNGTWAGWLTFWPAAGEGPVLSTGRETTQPNRDDLEYWATGLDATYYEGALQRALDAIEGVDREHFTAQPRERERAHAVLNPFAVYLQAPHLLDDELDALHPDHLRTIIRAYDLTDSSQESLEELDRVALKAIIQATVKDRLGS